MKAVSTLPKGTARNADFITGRAFKPGKKIIHTQRDLEDLPAHGWLCISEDTVKMMVKSLGWELRTGDEAELADFVAATARVAELEKQLDEIRRVVPA